MIKQSINDDLYFTHEDYGTGKKICISANGNACGNGLQPALCFLVSKRDLENIGYCFRQIAGIYKQDGDEVILNNGIPPLQWQTLNIKEGDTYVF